MYWWLVNVALACMSADRSKRLRSPSLQLYPQAPRCLFARPICYSSGTFDWKCYLCRIEICLKSNSGRHAHSAVEDSHATICICWTSILCQHVCSSAVQDLRSLLQCHAVLQSGCEFEPESIAKVHVQKAENEEGCWRYILKWRRLPVGSPEVPFSSVLTVCFMILSAWCT